MKIDLNKKRVIPEVTYSVVENLGWDARDKKQRTGGTITQWQFILFAHFDCTCSLYNLTSNKIRNAAR